MPKTALQRAKRILSRVTPLRENCGTLCDRRCCRGDEKTGMLLFAGEEALYQAEPGCTLTAQGGQYFLVCEGHCRRETRPLACMLYPLFPLLTQHGGKTELAVVRDPRGLLSCPLLTQELPMQKRFARAVQRCGRLLMRDEAQRRILLETSAMLLDTLSLQHRLQGSDDDNP